MPIHFDDLDVVSEVSGVGSALIVPCNLCPAVTVAVREKKPFLRLFRNFLKSAPFEQHIKSLRSRLKEKGVETEVFKSSIPHQWFLCMWTAGRREKLRERAKRHQAAIVLGCESATETVRSAVKASDCRVVEGMETTGVMNAELRLRPPCNVSFENCRIVPLSGRKKDEAGRS